MRGVWPGITMKVRLSQQEVNAIKNAVFSLDVDAKIYLFGSRADLSKKGGDIDLLVITQKLSPPDKLTILRRLFELIDEQKVDIIIAKDDADPFVKLAVKSGKLLS
jgi:predicted nucleotidyltransferase